MRYGIALVALLSGCSHTAWQISGGQPPPVNSQVQVHGSSGLATVFGLTILAPVLTSSRALVSVFRRMQSLKWHPTGK